MTDFDTCFLTYHRLLLRYALKFIGDEQEAMDLVQEVFIRLWEKGDFRLKEEQIKSFLFETMKNSCLNYLKHAKVVRRYESRMAVQLKVMEAYWYQSGEKSMIEKEAVYEIERAIDSLGDNYKEVILLSRIQGLKNHEIAEKLNIPVRTLETRIYRALALLREKIASKSLLILLTFHLSKK